MKFEPKNAPITLSNLDNLKVEIFWKTDICQKIVDHYKKDLPKKGTKGQFHDLLFADIGKALKGNVLIETVNEANKKFKAITRYKQQYYQAFFYIRQRQDCGATDFLMLVSIYRTYQDEDKKNYEAFEKKIKAKFKR